MSFESYGAALVPEMELDWPHTNERLMAEHAARRRARALAAWRALTGEDQ